MKHILLKRWLFALSGFFAVSALAAEVNIYSYRQAYLIEPVLEAFSEQTGIKTNLVYAKKGLIERLDREGELSPADLLLTSDINRLVDMEEAHLSQMVNSETLDANVPAKYRDLDGHWFGLTARARIIVTSKERVADGAIASYEDLAKPEWKEKICTRSGKHDYMVALIASMIAHHGEAEAKTWLEGVKANLAQKPQGNDRAQVKAIKEGVCDVAIINHYYMAAMLADPEQTEWANAVNVVFPNQADRGTHMNVSGVALTKSAPNKDAAIQLMEYLSSDEAQRIYAEKNAEYPVKQGVELAELLQSWGEFKTDDINLTIVAQQRSAAIKMADQVGYDD